MTLGYDSETETFYCYCLDDGNDSVAMVHSEQGYKCPNCNRVLTEEEAEDERGSRLEEKEIVILDGIASKYALHFGFNTLKELEEFEAALKPLGYIFRFPRR